MAIGTIVLKPGSAVMPDGSTGNLGPALSRFQGTETNPKKHFLVLLFDGAGNKEVAWWDEACPTDYASGGVIRIWWMANTTSAQNVVWSASIGAVTPGDADTPLEHANAAATSVTTGVNTTEARRLNTSVITLANLDSLAALDEFEICIYRDSSDASDTCTVDAEFKKATFEYTTT